MSFIHQQMAAAMIAASASASGKRTPDKEEEDVSSTTRQPRVDRKRWLVYDKRTGDILASCRWRWVANFAAWLECLGCDRWCEVCDSDTYDAWIDVDPDFDPPVKK